MGDSESETGECCGDGTESGRKRMRLEDLLSLDPNEQSVAIETIEPSALLEIQLEDDRNDDNVSHRLEGKRIVDVYYFLQKLQEIALHNIQLGCAFGDLKVLSESTEGLRSQICLYCSNCESSFSVNLSGVSGDVNARAAEGAERVGIGLEGLKKLFGGIGVPVEMNEDADGGDVERRNESSD